MGAVIGPYGLSLLNIPLDSPVLRAVSTLSLALVLFTDALSIDLADKPGSQSFDTGISNVTTVRVVIRAAAGIGAGKDIALGEIEFFKRP